MKALLFMVMISGTVYAQESGELIVGTYTDPGKSQGIYIFDFNEADADFSLRQTITGVENPSFLALGKANTLYAVNELSDGRGSVGAFSYGGVESQLINKLPSGGDAPCYVNTDKENNFLFVSNYSGGSLSVFRTQEDGSLKDQIQHIQYTGNGPNPDRQEAPHVHSSVFSPDERFILVQDLGTDKIRIYPFDSGNKEQPLQLSAVKEISTPPGRGPRHIVFSPSGKYVYVIAELTSSVLVYSFDRGEMSLQEEIGLLPENDKEKAGAADIHFSPDGKFLYASNRGNANELIIFQVNEKSGRLKQVGKQSVLGKGPRNFAITSNNKYLLVANQNSDEIVIFQRDLRNGKLSDTGKRIQVGSPVCLILN